MTTAAPVTAWVVTDAVIWKNSLDTRKADIKAWLRLNGISPGDIPADSTVMLAQSASGDWEIQYEVYLRSAEGNIRIDPDNPNEAFVEEQSSPLEFDPPMHWLVPVTE